MFKKGIVNKLILIVGILFPTLITAQHIKGLPFIKNYSPREYKATPQNLCISQNADGVFYFANAAGILEFNGKNWKLHKIPGNVAINCVFASKNGNIYVGAYNEFGFFERVNTGELKYNSLKPKVKDDIGKIISIHELNGEILFQARKGFYETRGRKVNFVTAPGNLHIAHFNEGRIYVKVKEKGLYEFNGKTFLDRKSTRLNSSHRL